MALDRFPGAAGGNAHFLVVVTRRTTGGKGVVQPETGFLGEAVCRVGEGCGALVGGNDEIGIIAIRAQRIRRRHDLSRHDVVGD